MKKFLCFIGGFLGGVLLAWTTITSVFCWGFTVCFDNGDMKKFKSWIDSIVK